jgi:hypothetical protein
LEKGQNRFCLEARRVRGKRERKGGRGRNDPVYAHMNK